jgi:two-component system sensor histidine kinase ChvG
MTRFLPSGIGMKVLAFNLLVVFLPLAAILYLDVYETQLLRVQERGMVQQARILAAALGQRDSLSAHDAAATLLALEERGDARLRVFDLAGSVIADSARLGVPAAAQDAERYPASAEGSRSRLLYRIGAWLAGVRRTASAWSHSVLMPQYGRPPAEPASAALPQEVVAALHGKYGASTRRTPGQRSLTLSSAVPIRHGTAVVGAVVVSQSTFRILQALYDVRLRIFEIVVASVLFSALLSVVVAARIVRPLTRLRRAAVALPARRGSLGGTFDGLERRDEIGDLARALDALTRRLDAHIQLLEAFAADVSHEFKNPLASIRTAAEMLATTGDRAERDRFLELLTRDVDRLDRLVSGVRELARIDAQLGNEPFDAVDVCTLLGEIVNRLEAGGDRSVTFVVRGAGAPCLVRGSPDRLAQVFENILLNAHSFAPAGTAVDVSVDSGGGMCRVVVADRGPGLPPEHLHRVFDRFFSYRPHERSGRRDHAGLGLSIAHAIVQGYGGTIAAANQPQGGASFVVRLPVVRTGAAAAVVRRAQPVQ